MIRFVNESKHCQVTIHLEAEKGNQQMNEQFLSKLVQMKSLKYKMNLLSQFFLTLAIGVESGQNMF